MRIRAVAAVSNTRELQGEERHPSEKEEGEDEEKGGGGGREKEEIVV